MRRFSLVVCVFAVFVFVFSTMASAVSIGVYSTGDTDHGQTSYFIANEDYANSNPAEIADAHIIALATPSGGSISKVEYTITATGLIVDSTGDEYILAYWNDANSDGVIAAGELYQVVNGTATGVVTVTVDAASGKLTFAALSGMKADADGVAGGEITIGTDGKLVIVQLDPGEAGTTFAAVRLTSSTTAAVAVAHTGIVGFNFKPPKNLANGGLTTITYTETATTTASATTTLATIANQLVARVSTPADGALWASRVTFSSGTDNGATDKLGVIFADRNLTNTADDNFADAENYLGRFLNPIVGMVGSIGDLGVYVDIYCSKQAIKEVKDSDAANVSYDNTNLRYRVGNIITFGDEDAGDLFHENLNTMTIDQIVPTNVRKFKVSVTSRPLAGFAEIVYLDQVAAGAWTYDGTLAWVPFMTYANDGNRTFVKFWNTAASQADVYVDLTPADGSMATQTFQLASIPANQVGTYKASDLCTLAGFPVVAPGTNFTALFTVTQWDVVPTAWFNLVTGTTTTTRDATILTDWLF